uniref:Uncharacterized protein n=1 Tax=viral metagenome TaxID=1070528 RepID=A0A6C0BVW8_9ZZZZ
MSGDGGVYIILEKATKGLREKINSDPELLKRFEAEYEKANMIQDNSDNIEKIIEKYNEEYENKNKKNYGSLLDRLANRSLLNRLLPKGGKKRRQKKTKKSRKQRKTRKLRKTRARK